MTPPLLRTAGQLLQRAGDDVWRLPTRIPLRLRLFFRAAFALLALAVLGLALMLLQEEKQRSLQAYRDGFAKTQAEIVARLRHPSGQLALLNPVQAEAPGAVGVAPRLLPFAAIDFDDRAKAWQAVEMAGCLVPYAQEGVDRAQLCVGVGNNPLAGGFIYTVGELGLGALVPRRLGERDLSLAHRVLIQVDMRGQRWRWVAPFEASAESPRRGRLTGFALDEQGRAADRPVRDFRGWLWQDARCVDEDRAAEPDEAACERRSYFSVRLPVELFRDELQTARGRLVWPPADLDRVRVRLQVLPPGAGATPLFDSAQPGAAALFGLQDLTALLQPGETLHIRRGATELALLTGQEDRSAPLSPLVDRLIRALPVDAPSDTLQASDTIQTALGRFEIRLTGDVRGVQRALGRVATRMLGFVGALLGAIALTWAAIELRLIRRITVLTRRAAVAAQGMATGEADGQRALDVADLRGSDELGLLAGTLGDLLQRVHEDTRREQIRLAQEQDQWHAVGHEIMSPLQSLMVLHADPDDPSRRYIQRMQQAIKVLYGQASPAEAFAATTLGLEPLDLDAFLQDVAANAPHAGIAEVRYDPIGQPLRVHADAYALEDVVTHVLRNADRHRPAGSAIRMTLQRQGEMAECWIDNRGPAIAPDRLERIFEYGVSDAPAPAPASEPGDAASTHRGQGLFVARTWMAKMGGTIHAENRVDDPALGGAGVRFVLRLPVAY